MKVNRWEYGLGYVKMFSNDVITILWRHQVGIFSAKKRQFLKATFLPLGSVLTAWLWKIGQKAGNWQAARHKIFRSLRCLTLEIDLSLLLREIVG